MPDIAMCEDNSCPSRRTCWRFVAPPNGRHQWYATFNRDGRDKCDDFLTIRDSRQSQEHGGESN